MKKTLLIFSLLLVAFTITASARQVKERYHGQSISGTQFIYYLLDETFPPGKEPSARLTLVGGQKLPTTQQLAKLGKQWRDTSGISNVRRESDTVLRFQFEDSIFDSILLLGSLIGGKMTLVETFPPGSVFDLYAYYKGPWRVQEPTDVSTWRAVSASSINEPSVSLNILDKAAGFPLRVLTSGPAGIGEGDDEQLFEILLDTRGNPYLGDVTSRGKNLWAQFEPYIGDLPEPLRRFFTRTILHELQVRLSPAPRRRRK